MIRCQNCGHMNLPSYPTCGKCGASMTGAAAAQAQEDYARMMAERAGRSRRNRLVYVMIGLIALGLFGFRWVQDAHRKGNAQEKLDYASHWIDLEKRETGLFWNCALASEVDVGLFSNAGQIQQRIEAAYATQQKTFSEHLLTECVPKLDAATAAFMALPAPPDEFKSAMHDYNASLPELKKGLELYADRIQKRQGTKDVDQLIQEVGNAWQTETRATPETIAYEKFLHCAIPGLDKLKGIQQMLEYLADVCYKKDPVSFMDRIRKECGPLLANVDAKASPSKTFKVSQKKFYEEEPRQLEAWDSCSRKARKGKKVEDLGEFLVATGDYMKARAEVGATARAIGGGSK